MNTTTPQFGDLVLNNWAAKTNPLRFGIFVRENKRTYLITDGRGKFWETMIKDNRLEITGTALDMQRIPQHD